MDATTDSRRKRGATDAGAAGSEAGHVTELENAFRTLARDVPGLSVEVVGRVAEDTDLVHPTAGFQVRLKRVEPQLGASLYVSARYGELTTWRGPAVPGVAGALRERFRVNLDAGYGWGDSEFGTADALAQGLLGYMQFQLDAIDPMDV
jgi:hypothetical protein